MPSVDASVASNHHDLIIVGGGPAGYTAALYAARAGLDALVIEQGMPGGQIATSDEIDNYPGIPHISGAEIGMKMQEHAESAGAQTAYAMVGSITHEQDGSFVVAGDDATYDAPAIIAAMGATPRLGGFKGEDAYRGRGISYCATCDGMFYRGKKVFVIGGGNSACEEAVYLSRIAESVEIVVRRDQFRASKGMVKRVLDRPNITVRYQTSIVEVDGGQLLNKITFRDNASGETHVEEFPEGSFGIFVFIGNDAQTALIKDLVELGPDGAVLTDDAMATRTPGLFCAGDIRSKGLRQVITAASDGAIAATSAYRYLDENGLLAD